MSNSSINNINNYNNNYNNNNNNISNNKEIIMITNGTAINNITQNNNKMLLYKNNLIYNDIQSINSNGVCRNSIYSNNYVVNSNSITTQNTNTNSNTNNPQSFVGYIATTTIDATNSGYPISPISNISRSISNSSLYPKQQYTNNLNHQIQINATSDTSSPNQVILNNNSNIIYQPNSQSQNSQFSYNQGIQYINQNENNIYVSKNEKVYTLSESSLSLNDKPNSVVNPCINYNNNSPIIQTNSNVVPGHYIEKSNIITYPVYNYNSNNNGIHTNTIQGNTVNNVNLVNNTIPNNIKVTNNAVIPNNVNIVNTSNNIPSNINVNTINNTNIISNSANTNANCNISSVITVNVSKPNTISNNCIAMRNNDINNNINTNTNTNTNTNNIIVNTITNSPLINTNINSPSIVLPESIIKTTATSTFITPNSSPIVTCTSSLNDTISNGVNIINNGNTSNLNCQMIKNSVSPSNFKYLVNNNGNIIEKQYDPTVKVYDQSILNDLYYPTKRTREGNSKIKIHICECCGKTFNKASRLRDHMLTHVKTRAFQCETCHLPFKRKNDMLRHMRIHTGYKPYKCKNCGKGFTRSDALSRHVKGGLCQIISTEQQKKEEKDSNITKNTDKNITEQKKIDFKSK